MELSNPDFWLEMLTQISIMLLIFLVNLFALSTLVFKPTLKILKERDKRLSGMKKEAAYFEEQFDAKLNDYNGLMEEARHMARQAREDILKQAEIEKQDIITKARKMSEEELSTARQKLVTEVEDAKRDLKQKSQELSQEMVAKVLGKRAA